MSEGGERINCMFGWQSNTIAVTHSFKGAHSDPRNTTEVRLTVRGKQSCNSQTVKTDV